jgi:hypothetical protein
MKNLDNKVKNKIINSITSSALNRNSGQKFNTYIHTKIMSEHEHTNGFSEPLKLNTSVKTTPQTMVLVDKEPLANWGHDCEYHLYDAQTGKILEVITARFPPASFLISFQDYEAVGDLIEHTSDPEEGKVKINSTPGLDKLNSVAGTSYALLFSGMSNNRHLNDMEYLYRVLIDVYKLDAANITVLNYDGTINYSGSPQPVGNWPGDNTPYRIKVNGQGTKAELESKLDAMANKLSRNDFLIIHTNNHGGGPTSTGSNTPSTLCCYPNWDSMTDTQFGAKLATFPKFASLVVMMEQCHSGGFSEPTINNSTALETEFSAAAIATKNSMGGKNFDPYAYQWINSSNNTKYSVHKIFETSLANKHTGDTPNEASSPTNSGNVLWLNNSKNPALNLNNNSYMSAPSNSAYNFGSGNFSLEAWVKPLSTGTIFGKKSTEGGNTDCAGFLLVLEPNGAFKLATDNGFGYSQIISDSTNVMDGNWHHVAAVRSGENMHIYVDGKTINSTVSGSLSSPLEVNNGLDLLIGSVQQQQEAYIHYFGAIKEARVWDIALSLDQIKSGIDINLQGNENGLVGYWPLNQDGQDLSDIHNNASANGSVSFAVPNKIVGNQNAVTQKTVEEKIAQKNVVFT